LGGQVVQAQPVDLTGTYEGSWICKEVRGDGFKGRTGMKPSTLQITQTSSSSNRTMFNASVDGQLFSGRSIDTQEGKKGVGVLVDCDSGNSAGGYAEIELILYSTKKVKKSGVFQSGPSDGIGVCKGRWKKMNGADPLVSACP